MTQQQSGAPTKRWVDPPEGTSTITFVADEAHALLDDGTSPVVDANGDPVDLPPEFEVDSLIRLFFAGRVPARDCPHYIAKSEARAGYRRCEHCQRGRSFQVGVHLDETPAMRTV
ncbi:hypothetical protein [Micromonospora maritima]|uniref:hypothetical protein n=1 Tax=Micromonospora maritima TaxID=986711 RepID=UPI00157CAB06|nr:hypothetical protein [Micromonospora maritima]